MIYIVEIENFAILQLKTSTKTQTALKSFVDSEKAVISCCVTILLLSVYFLVFADFWQHYLPPLAPVESEDLIMNATDFSLRT